MTKRRSAQQIAADAQAAYRATVAKAMQSATMESDKYAKRATALISQADEARRKQDVATMAAEKFEAELARLDAAAATLQGTLITATDSGGPEGDYTATVVASRAEDGTLTVHDVAVTP